jgi:hypothetical protein
LTSTAPEPDERLLRRWADEALQELPSMDSMIRQFVDPQGYAGEPVDVSGEPEDDEGDPFFAPAN